MQMDRLIERCGRLLEGTMAAALALMVVLVFGNVVLRYVFNSGITVSEELSRWLFVWLTFIGAVLAMKEHAHMGTDMLVSRFGNKGKKICLVVSQLAMLYVLWLLFKGGYEQMLINADSVAPVTGASMGIFYASGVFFSIPSALLLLRDMWRTLTGRVPPLSMSQGAEELAPGNALYHDANRPTAGDGDTATSASTSASARR